MILVGPLNSGAAAGGNGSATANATSSTKICGRVIAIHVKYNDSPPAATTDVTVATSGTACPAQTLLAITDSATDAWHYPMVAAKSTAGAAITYDGTRPIYTPLAIYDHITVTIAQANAADNADVYLLME